MRYCVMQPYFFPHAAYYRLFFEVDLFVIFDNAQFPRRGRVHRCEFRSPSGDSRWITLPLARAPQRTPISEIRLRDGAGTRLISQLTAFAGGSCALGRVEGLREALTLPKGFLVDFLFPQHKFISHCLGDPCRFLRASEIRARGREDYQDYIIGIGRALGASLYVNLPGGRELYDHRRFEEAGLEVEFLPSAPSGVSILQNWDESFAWLAKLRAQPVQRKADTCDQGCHSLGSTGDPSCG